MYSDTGGNRVSDNTSVSATAVHMQSHSESVAAQASNSRLKHGSIVPSDTTSNKTSAVRISDTTMPLQTQAERGAVQVSNSSPMKSSPSILMKQQRSVNKQDTTTASPLPGPAIDSNQFLSKASEREVADMADDTFKGQVAIDNPEWGLEL